MILEILQLKRTKNRGIYFDKKKSGFTLVEIMVAVGIFSIVITIVFTILAQSARYKKVNKGTERSVFIVDSFLHERKLKNDAVEYFFSKDDRDLIYNGKADQLIDQILPPQSLYIDEGGIRYELELKTKLLLAYPFLFRARVECRWKANTRGNTNYMRFSVSTVFHYDGEKLGKKKNGEKKNQ
ncbi:MAG: type II secretion system protein [Spirochaetes bacterium]|nr:type II secretion system protein [Spirochaetota bacterium]